MEEQDRKTEIQINLTYPRSQDFEYETRIEVLDLDKESEADIASGNGFLIEAPKSTNKKDMKSPNGIYSPKFGQKLGDLNPYADKYSCECGYLKSRIHNGMVCPMCNTICKYVDDNFKIFGWIRLKDKYHIIHPKFYDTLDYFFGPSPYNIKRKRIKGSKLQNMLNHSPDVDPDGHWSECSFKPDNEPFYGIGMIEFYNRFDEILNFYYNKNPKKKKDVYDEILYYRDIIFCHNIPVFTTHLRPTDIRDKYMYYEPTNGIYNMINKHVHTINKDRRKLDQDIKIKNASLFRVQMRYMELSTEIMNILTGKKGQLRMLVGARYNFICRAVIRQDPSLRIDQVKLPYVELVKCLQPLIENVLIRSYNISPSQAYNICMRAIAVKDERVAEIIDTLIKSTHPEGLPLIINRNPTINFGTCRVIVFYQYVNLL